MVIVVFCDMCLDGVDMCGSEHVSRHVSRQCQDMRLDMCLDMCLGKGLLREIFRHAFRHVPRHVSLHVPRLEFRHLVSQRSGLRDVFSRVGVSAGWFRHV